uniref:Uncharacterized protein n=1 Tax=Glossina palpalis gambiensis TaxID=67801 RepID=A0A1B0BCM0_9MUSC
MYEETTNCCCAKSSNLTSMVSTKDVPRVIRIVLVIEWLEYNFDNQHSVSLVRSDDEYDVEDYEYSGVTIVFPMVPKSTAETPSSAPSSFCSPTTGATATASTIAGRSGALKPPDNCQPTFNTLPTPPTAITPGTSSSIRARAHTRTTTINSTNTRLSMKIHPFNQRLFTSKRGYLCKGRHESQDTSGFQQYPSVKYHLTE